MWMTQIAGQQGNGCSMVFEPCPRSVAQQSFRQDGGQSGARTAAAAAPVWQVGALCRAVADALDARFGAVTVIGEISGFTRASSGHCYFSLKDDSGQLRCAMFRRTAGLLQTLPREGDQVEVRGRLAVYEQRGDLQLIVESLRRAGQGALYEDFLRRKAALERQGLFDPARKRQPGRFPRGIAVVTSSGAAALHDVLTALRRRAPHVPVLLAPALVQGAEAPGQLVQALQRLYALAQRQQSGADTGLPQIDTILLVRGGGSLEDLWAFNDEQLAHAIVQSPVPLISGVGHETDFTIADFCADVRAPTPTAAAELAAMPAQDAWLQASGRFQRVQQLVLRQLDLKAQRLDRLGWGMVRSARRLPTERLHLQELGARLRQQQRHGLDNQRLQLQRLQARLQQALSRQVVQGGQRTRLQGLQHRLALAREAQLRGQHQRLERAQQALQQQASQQCRQARHRLQVAERALHLLGPLQPLQRGYALLQDSEGRLLRRRADFLPGQRVTAIVADGRVPLQTLPDDGA